MLAKCRKKPQQGGGFQKRRAWRVGHQHIARPDRLQQTGHTQGRIGAKFQRVQELVVDAFQQPMYPYQSFEGFEKQGLVSHDQVVAFHQRQTQVTRQVNVFEIGFVVGPGREQCQM